MITWFNRWPEAQARIARWALLLGWLGLLALLLRPELGPAYRSIACREATICRPGIGNDLFWNVGLPLVILAVLLSHELWRRICPLSFVSQLFRALGWQRTVLNRAGKPQVAAISESSWLARHHIQLQWSLLIAGLSLRLLIANSNGPIMALLFAASLLAALISGWAYGGKTFCQYLCPFAPAQQILSGPRSLLSSQAHLSGGSKTTQSMCRTVGAQGQDISTCVACAKPCFDIDAERTYWQSLSGKRGMAWAWYSYPGLILAFFLLIQSDAPAEASGHGIDYLRSNLYTYDGRLAAMAWQSLLPAGWPQLPRLLAVPALLSAGGVVSERLFHQIEQLQRNQLSSAAPELAKERAIHRTRLLATFTAINTYFFFKGNLLDSGTTLLSLNLVIVAISSVWLYRNWDRDRGLYERESTSTSLRRRLARLGPDLQPLLAGRQLDDLSPGEVFVLANALPVQETSQRRSIYLDVLRDLISQGRLDRTASLKALVDLRTSLGLDDADHQSALEILTSEDARITSLSAEDLAGLNLCRNAAAQEIEDLLLLSGSTVLHIDRLDAHGRGRLNRIQIESGLDDDSWAQLLNDFGPGSQFGERQLSQRLQLVNQAMARRESLAEMSQRLPLAAPLVLSLDRQIARFLPDLVALIRSGLTAREEHRPDEACLALLRGLSPNVLAFLAAEDDTTTAINTWLDGVTLSPLQLSPLPAAGEILEGLWLDTDPSVSLWALMVLRQLDAPRSERLTQAPRTGLPTSATLTAFLQGEQLASREILTLIAEQPLIQRLEPGALLALHRLCSLQQWRQGDPIELPSAGVLIILDGCCEQRESLVPGSAPKTLAEHRGGSIVGLADYFGDHGSAAKARFVAASQGCSALVFSHTGFSELIDVSPIFEQALIRELALQCESLQRTLQSERQQQQHQRMRRMDSEQLGRSPEDTRP
ncbi:MULTISPECIES: cyclic nucleotide-binding protein [unclassified Cyanobium]|uniref:cyclic nucleotide-binding protein n=1 Tax=unclassified Cyanobium TaxID=2627006 RepID=UPI0020CB8617|nr:MULTISPECIES: cyclic nucleotide-binding protein [unclassified Cyanobium]MCP9776642.1 cyclic nucleotide-binding protein [Cyanobium sp. Tous-M-B4]MCP9877060.1 cyclic nucleotide-binding protein [Cyanobium sp. A2C-AMD]